MEGNGMENIYVLEIEEKVVDDIFVHGMAVVIAVAQRRCQLAPDLWFVAILKAGRAEAEAEAENGVIYFQKTSSTQRSAGDNFSDADD